ncbi:hypothetical protein [Eubacterium callanderi]|uniref:hypothetical protein n=1 Tax=Eubacterium callanderi TaxID=53442 RepID=UPI0029FEF992|nr:hypothetical protein [Eubacterium callanderi]
MRGKVANKDNVDWKRADLSRFLLLKSWHDICVIKHHKNFVIHALAGGEFKSVATRAL